MTAENDQDCLEPKPPKLLQNLKWFWIHGWRYRWYVVSALIILALLFFGKRYLNQRTVPDVQRGVSTQGEPEGASAELKLGQESSDQLRSAEDAPLQERVEPDVSNSVEADTTHPTAKTPVLTTGESPDEILDALSKLVRSRRDERARELYEGRWIPEPGWTGVVFGLPSRSGQGWLFSINHERADGTLSTSLTHLFTKQDAAGLRRGVRVHVTGKIRKVSVLGLSLEEVRFDIVHE